MASGFSAPGFQEGELVTVAEQRRTKGGKETGEVLVEQQKTPHPVGGRPVAGAAELSPGVPEGGFQLLGQLGTYQDQIAGQTQLPVIATGSGMSGADLMRRLSGLGLNENDPFARIIRTPGAQSPDAIDFGRWSAPGGVNPSPAAPFGDQQADITRKIISQFDVPITIGDIERAQSGGMDADYSAAIADLDGGQQDGGGGGSPGIQRSQQPMISDDFGGSRYQFSPAVAPQPQGGGQDQFSPSPEQRLAPQHQVGSGQLAGLGGGGQPQNPLGSIGMQQLGQLFQQLFGRGPQLGGFGGGSPLGPVPFAGSRGMMRRPLPPVQMRSPFGRC